MSVIIRLQGLPWSASALDIRNFFQGLGIPAGGVHIIGGEKGDAFIAFSTDEDARQAMNKNFETLTDSVIKLFLSSKTEMQNIIEQARAPPANSGPSVPDQSPKAPDQHGRSMDNENYGRDSNWGAPPKDSFQRPDPANAYNESQSSYSGPQEIQKYPRNDDAYPDPGNYNYGQQDAGLNRTDGDNIAKDAKSMPHEMRPSRPGMEPFMPGQQRDFRGPPNMKPVDETFPPNPRNMNWQNEFDGSMNRGPREDMKYPPDVRNPQNASYPPEGKFDSEYSQSDGFDPWSQNVHGLEEPDDIPQFDESGRQIFPTEQRSLPGKTLGPAFNNNNERQGSGFLPARNALDNQVRDGFEPVLQRGRPYPDDPDLRKDAGGPLRGPNADPRLGNVGSPHHDDRDFRNAPRERHDLGRMDAKPDFYQENSQRNPNQFNRPNMDERRPNSSANYPRNPQDYRSGFPPNQGADNFEPGNQSSNTNVPPDAPRGTFGPGEYRGRFPPDGPRQFQQDGGPGENIAQDMSGERYPPDRLRERFPPDGSGDRYPPEGPRMRFRPDDPNNAGPPDGPGGRFPPERLGRGRFGPDGPRMPQDALGRNVPPELQAGIIPPQGPRSRAFPEGPEMQGRIPFERPGGRFLPEGARGRMRPGGPFRGPLSQFEGQKPWNDGDAAETEIPNYPDVERTGIPDVANNRPPLLEGNTLDQPNADKWKDGRRPYGNNSVRPDTRPSSKPLLAPNIPGKGLLGDAPPSAKLVPEDKDNRDPSERSNSSYDSRNMGRPRASDDSHSGGYGRRGNQDSARMSSRDSNYRDRDIDRSRSRGRYDDRDHDRRSDSYYRSDRRQDDHSRSGRYSDRDSRTYSERDRDRDQSRRDRDSRSDQSKSGSERDRDSRSSQSKSATDKDSRTDSKTSTDKDNRSDSRGSKRVRSDETRTSFHVVLHSMSSDVSYREVRRFFAPVEIPFDGLKLINDEFGRRTGKGYIKFASEVDVNNALKKSGTNMNGTKVEIQRCTKEDYENAIDSFIPDNDSPPIAQKRLKPNESEKVKEPETPASPPFIAALKGLPPKITKQDIVQFLSGITIAKGGDAVYIDIDQKGIGTGTVYVEVTTSDDLKKVFACECRTMGPRLIRVGQAKREDIDTVLEHQKKFHQFENNLDFDNRKLEDFAKKDISLLGKPPDNDTKRIEQSPLGRRNDSDNRISEDSHFLCLSGLPPQCTQREIRDFCHGLTIAPRGLQICHDGDGKGTGEAFIEFSSKEHYDLCLQRDKQNVGHHAISVETVTKGEMVARMRQARMVSMFGPSSRNPMQASSPLISEVPSLSVDSSPGEGTRPIPPGVLKRHWFYLRCSNLPLSVTIREILGFFQGHNPVPESIRLHYTGDGHPTGNAVVGFESRDEAMKAMHELNNAPCRQNNVVINPASY